VVKVVSEKAITALFASMIYAWTATTELRLTTDFKLMQNPSSALKGTIVSDLMDLIRLTALGMRYVIPSAKEAVVKMLDLGTTAKFAALTCAMTVQIKLKIRRLLSTDFLSLTTRERQLDR
jgi:hypothetical protein